MECGSPSRHTWADEVDEAESLSRSPSAGLNPDAEPFSPAASGFGKGKRLSFTDSEASFGSEAPSPATAGRGKEPAPTGGRRRRPRRQGGLMADARRTYRSSGVASPPPIGRLHSFVVHPARFSVEPDFDRFRQVHGHRQWRRRASPTLARPVPADLVSLCFNCLGDDHVKVDCMFRSRCSTCRREGKGHRARNCLQGPPTLVGAKRGHSPAGAGGHCGAFRRRVS